MGGTNTLRVLCTEHCMHPTRLLHYCMGRGEKEKSGWEEVGKFDRSKGRRKKGDREPLE